MKAIILKNGLISGIIVSACMVYGTITCYNNPSVEPSMILGFAGMFIAFAFIFVGIGQYRTKIGNGFITFKHAFKIALFITLICSTFYVVTWLIELYVFIPDFMDKYTEHVLKTAEAKGASAAEMETKRVEMAEYSEIYKNPLGVIAFTYMEILPLGLIVSLIAALVMKRKEKTIE